MSAWEDVSMDKSTYSSCRAPGVVLSTHIGWFTTTVNPISGYLLSSSGHCEHCTQVLHIQKNRHIYTNTQTNKT